MANPLKLPFDFPPNSTPTTQQIQANFNALLGFVQNLDTGLTSLTNLVLSGSLSLPNGTAPAPSLKFTNSTTTGLYRAGSNNMGVSTDGTTAWNADADQNILQPGQPAFRVSNSNVFLAQTSINPYNFITEQFDTQNNFDLTTDTFTAPVDGIYLFFFQVCVTPSGNFNLYINNNGSLAAFAPYSSAAGQITAILPAIIPLDANDAVTAAIDSTLLNAFDTKAAVFSGGLVN